MKRFSVIEALASVRQPLNIEGGIVEETSDLDETDDVQSHLLSVEPVASASASTSSCAVLHRSNSSNVPAWEPHGHQVSFFQVMWHDQYQFRSKFLAAAIREGKFQYLGCVTSLAYLLDTPHHNGFLSLPLLMTSLCVYHLFTVFVSDLEIMRAMAMDTMHSVAVQPDDVKPVFAWHTFWQLCDRFPPFRRRMLYVGASVSMLGLSTLVIIARVLLFARWQGWTTSSAFLNCYLPALNIFLYGLVSAIDFWTYAEDKYRIALLLQEQRPPTFQLMFAVVPVLFKTK